jgi:DNA-directed RNA polymerase specialized sigma24 family protein
LGGDAAAAHELFARPDIQEELLKIARAIVHRRGNCGGRVTLSDLLTDLFLRLNVSFMKKPDRSFENRAMFYAYAMYAVDKALLTHARRFKRELPPGGFVGVEQVDRELRQELAWLAGYDPLDILTVLCKVDEVDRKAAYVVRRRVFYEATYPQIAEELDVALITAKRLAQRGYHCLREVLLGPAPKSARA